MDSSTIFSLLHIHFASSWQFQKSAAVSSSSAENGCRYKAKDLEVSSNII